MLFLIMAIAAATPQPKTSPSTWIRSKDYPRAIQRRGQEGRVGAKLAVSAEGAVSGCEIIISSGDQSLDRVTCDLLTKRAVFTPAKNARGQPVPSVYPFTVQWAIPFDSVTDKGAILHYAFSPSGEILACSIQQFGDSDDSDLKCESFQNAALLSSTLGVSPDELGSVDVSLTMNFEDDHSLAIPDRQYDKQAIIAGAELDISPQGTIAACRQTETNPLGGRTFDLCQIAPPGPEKFFHASDPKKGIRRVRVAFEICGILKSAEY